MFKGGVLGNDNREMEMTFVNGLFMLGYVLDIDGYDGTTIRLYNWYGISIEMKLGSK